MKMETPSKSALNGWLLAVAVVAVSVMVAFSPWILDGKVLAPLDIIEEMYLPWRGDGRVPMVQNHFVSDAVTQYLPYRIIAARSFEEDGFLGWNPFVLGGVAQNANTMALSYDWATHLHRVVGFWPAWHLGLIGRFLIAGLGMMVFLKSRGCKSWVATTSSIAYMLNTEFVNWVYHQWALASFCWMPWFLWSLHRCREKSSRYLALAAIFLGLSLLGATLQHAAFIVIALACVWMGWMFEGQSGTKVKGLELQAASGQRSRGWDTLLVVAAGLLGAGLVAFMLEPSVTGYLENVRSGHEREGLGYASGLSQPFRMAMVWPLKLYPFVLGSVQTLDLTKAFLPSGVAYVFFGTIPMLLAIIGLFSRRVPLAAKLLIVAGSIIPLTPLVGVLYQRVGLLWILGGCWASGVWLSAAHDESLRRVSTWCWRMLAGVLVLWTLASIALVFFREPLETLLIARAQAAAASSQFAMFPEWVGTRAAKLLDYLCVWNPWQLAALAGLLFSLWGMTRCKGESLWPGAVLSVGVALQLSVYWWQWTTWSVERGVYEQPELVRILQQEVGTGGRLAQGSGGPSEIHLPANTLAPTGVAITVGYDSIHPDGMRSSTGHPWDFPGTTHFLGRLGEEHPVDWQEVWTDGRWALLRNPEPTVGMITLGSGLTVPLRPNDLLRETLNTMEVTVPAGSVKLEVFSNWNRGWKWRDSKDGRWGVSSAGPSKGVEVVLDQSLLKSKVVYLQFDPKPPVWVMAVTGLSALALVALALLGCLHHNE